MKVVLTFSMLCFAAISSCQSISIEKVDKKIIPAGRPGQPIRVQYSSTVSIDKAITLQAIELENSDQKLDITVIKLPNGLIIDSAAFLMPGNYYFNATTTYVDAMADSDDTLIFRIKDSSNATFNIKKKTRSVRQ